MGTRTIAVATVAAGLVGAAVAYAAIPGSEGVIAGCYAKNNGGLRVIDAEAGATCSAKELPLSWNQTGPQGPPGPQGPAGEDAEIGTRHIGQVTSLVTSTADGFDLKSVTASCADDPLTGGGHRVDGAPGVLAQVNVTSSVPTGTPPSAWTVSASAPTGVGPWSVEARAVCATEPGEPGPLP